MVVLAEAIGWYLAAVIVGSCVGSILRPFVKRAEADNKEILMVQLPKMKRHERRFWESPDLATPEERRWLDKLERERPEMAPMKITQRDGPETGQFNTVTKLMRRRGSGTMFGCYCMNLDWIKMEARRCRKRRLKEEQREIDNLVGAFI